MSNFTPAYPKTAHGSGQARIRIGKKDVYLGKFSSRESLVKYTQIVAELGAGGIPKPPTELIENFCRAAATVADNAKPTSAELINKFCRMVAELGAGGVPKASKNDEPVTCAELINLWRPFGQNRYVKDGEQTSEFYLYKLALAPVLELYGDMPVKLPDDPDGEFGPLELIACRDWLRDVAGYCRKQINRHVGRIRRVWKWGVARKIVRESSWNALKAVEGFREGEAEDNAPVEPVAIERVNAIKDHVLPPIWAMIQLQLFTGMRPGEVCQMRTCDIVTEDRRLPEKVRKTCWTYTPRTHKTKHHKKQRIIVLGPKAQRIVERWLRPTEPDKYLFSPAEAMKYSIERKVKNATTHKKRVDPTRSPPKRSYGDRYKTHAYAAAIERGCELAFQMPREIRFGKHTERYKALSPEQAADVQEKARLWRQENCWNPNQLRHTAATEIRKEHGLELSRIILGHSSAVTTEIYAEVDLGTAAKAMVDFG